MKLQTIIASVLVFLGTISANAGNLVCPEGTQRETEGDITAEHLEFCAKTVNGAVVKHGPYAVYSSRVEKSEIGQYESGKATGTWIALHPNTGGKKGAEGPMCNDIKCGKWTYWHKNGQIEQTEEHLSDGVVQTAEYYESGAKANEGKKRNDKPFGEWAFYSLEGKLIAKGDFAAAEKKFKQYVAQLNSAQGIALTEGVFNPCYRAQLQSLQSGGVMNTKWIPKKGQLFRADDSYYKIAAVISQNPVRLLIEGTANAGEAGLKNSCLIVVTVKDRNKLKTTTAPFAGYEVRIGDSIIGFKLKSLGTTAVKIQSLRSISSVDANLPNFELVSEIPIANK